MKHLVISIIDSHDCCEEILKKLSNDGFNGSVVPSTSFKHTLENGGDIPMFVNLSHFESDRLENSSTIMVVVEEEKIDEVFKIVKGETEDFTKAKGGIFSLPIDHFEGSF